MQVLKCWPGSRQEIIYHLFNEHNENVQMVIFKAVPAGFIYFTCSESAEGGEKGSAFFFILLIVGWYK